MYIPLQGTCTMNWHFHNSIQSIVHRALHTLNCQCSIISPQSFLQLNVFFFHLFQKVLHKCDPAQRIKKELSQFQKWNFNFIFIWILLLLSSLHCFSFFIVHFISYHPLGIYNEISWKLCCTKRKRMNEQTNKQNILQAYIQDVMAFICKICKRFVEAYSRVTNLLVENIFPSLYNFALNCYGCTWIVDLREFRIVSWFLVIIDIKTQTHTHTPNIFCI